MQGIRLERISKAPRLLIKLAKYWLYMTTEKNKMVADGYLMSAMAEYSLNEVRIQDLRGSLNKRGVRPLNTASILLDRSGQCKKTYLSHFSIFPYPEGHMNSHTWCFEGQVS